MTRTLEEQLARLGAEAEAYANRAGRIDARLWQLQRRGADLHALRDRLHAAAAAIARLRAAMKVA